LLFAGLTDKAYTHKMCPLSKFEQPAHPLLDHSLFNSLNVKCVVIMTHDVLTANSPYLICTECYNPAIYNRVLTQYSHTFQYGNVPTSVLIAGVIVMKNDPFLNALNVLKPITNL